MTFNIDKISEKTKKVDKYRIAYDQHFEAEIGDFENVDFKPKVKLKKWGGECHFSVELSELVGSPIPKKIKPVKEVDIVNGVSKEKLKWKDNDKEIHFYPVDDIGNGNGNGFEYEIVFKKKPDNNIISLNIQTQGLTFYYQEMPTSEEIEIGVTIPENAIGSYAVYHSTKTNFHYNQADADKYKTGKAFHIYRPKVIDANGNSVWADLNIDIATGKMTITISQTFLDNAIYPVIVDPTFGNTSIGVNFINQAANGCRGSSDQTSSASSGMIGTSMSIYLKTQAGTGNVKGFFTKSSDLLIVTNSITPGDAISTTAGWHTMTFAAHPSIVASTDYVLWSISDVAYTIYYDSAGSVSGYIDSSNSYASPTNPTDATRNNPGDNRLYSIYITYVLGIGVNWITA